MIDFATHRQRLHAKIAAVRASRAPQTLLEAKGGCQHDWRKFKQSVRPRGEWIGMEAYFVVLGCERCKAKRTVDYVVER
ncbi:hypothetical protein [uncultured Kocuria sp.]|uniref:hypothetical protein n=1 Tax=uncultured Kocuria sp. TaxID=259305 RepID=UPI0026118B63|nr:hypothetical protein [uncultured Kocuria sp.]